MAILTPYSYNGTSLQSSDWECTFPRANGNAQLQTSVSYVKRAGAPSLIAGKQFSEVGLVLDVYIKHDVMTTLESLNQLFDTKDDTPRQFIVVDEEDGDKQYYVYVTPRRVMGGHAGSIANVDLAVDDPIWRAVTESSDTKAITGTTDTISLAVGGNDYAYPKFAITPTAVPSTDFVYSTFARVLPTASVPVTNRPVYLAPSTDTWDTAALIAAGKMQSAGQDIRVLRDSQFIDFQITGIDSTDTKLLINTDLPEARTMPLKTAIAGSGIPTYIEIINNVTNLAVFNKLPAAGRVVIYSALGATDTEEFTYTAKSSTTTTLFLTVSNRGQRGTIDVAHSASDTVAFLPYDFTILYGNATAEAYAIDETRKPIIDLASSNNSSHVYNQFYDLAQLRSGIWFPYVKATNPLKTRSDTYTSTNDVEDVDPADVIGNKALSYQDAGVWKADTVTLEWILSVPEKIASLSASGNQSQNIAVKPANTISVSKRETPTTYVVASTITAQATTDFGTWTAWTKASTDFVLTANTYSNVALRSVGTLSSTTDNYAKVEAETVTVGLSNPVHVMFTSEASNIKLDCRITNANTGEYIDLVIPMRQNDTAYIDTDPDFPKVTYNGLLISGTVKPSTIRSAWIKLVGNATNTLYFDSNIPATNITIVTTWRDRLNFF